MLIWAAKRPPPSVMAVPSAVGPFCESTNVSCTCSNDPNPDPLTWTTVPGRAGNRVLSEAAGSVDLADPLPVVLGEPQVPVGARSHEGRLAVGGRDGELGDHAGRGDPGHAARAELREPQVAIRANRDP